MNKLLQLIKLANAFYTMCKTNRKGILQEIKDPTEKEKTIKAINGLLDEMQTKFNGFSTAFEEVTKKQGKQ